jgi:hypothetical protein
MLIPKAKKPKILANLKIENRFVTLINFGFTTEDIIARTTIINTKR